jgi:nucleotide-binding universal stress UspA family protein
MVKKILVPIDGSENSIKAIEFAANIAKQNDAIVHLLHVMQTSNIPEAIFQYIRGEMIKESPMAVYRQYVQNNILKSGTRLAKKIGLKNFKTSILEGDPSEKIIEFAKEGNFDMLVIGSRGLGNVKGLLLGSVSSKVCHLTDRTCVTVK